MTEFHTRRREIVKSIKKVACMTGGSIPIGSRNFSVCLCIDTVFVIHWASYTVGKESRSVNLTMYLI
jgi:hypothetical protein